MARQEPPIHITRSHDRTTYGDNDGNILATVTRGGENLWITRCYASSAPNDYDSTFHSGRDSAEQAAHDYAREAFELYGPPWE
jgi:hypothetical protein